MIWALEGRLSGEIWEGPRRLESGLTALSGFGTAAGGIGQGDDDGGAAAWAALLAVALVESLAGDDAVDFCVECQQAALVWLSREASGKSADG